MWNGYCLHLNSFFQVKMNSTNNQWEFSFAVKLIIFLLLITILIIGRELLIPLTIAIFFTFLLYPVSRWLENHKIPRAISIIISLLIAIVFFGAIVYFFIYQLYSFGEDIPLLKEQITIKGSKGRADCHKFCVKYSKINH